MSTDGQYKKEEESSSRAIEQSINPPHIGQSHSYHFLFSLFLICPPVSKSTTHQTMTLLSFSLLVVFDLSNLPTHQSINPPSTRQWHSSFYLLVVFDLSNLPTHQWLNPPSTRQSHSYHFLFLLFSRPKKFAAARPAFLRATSHWDSFHFRYSRCHSRLMISDLFPRLDIQ